MYIDVIYSDLGLTAPPTDINTYVTCKSQCFTLSGVDDLYNVKRDHFRIFVISQFWPTYTPQQAKEHGFVLNWSFYGCQ